MIAMQVKTKTILGETAFKSLFPQHQQSLSLHQQAPMKYRFIKGQAVGQPRSKGEGKKDSAKAHMDPVMCQHPAESMIPSGGHAISVRAAGPDWIPQTFRLLRIRT